MLDGASQPLLDSLDGEQDGRGPLAGEVAGVDQAEVGGEQRRPGSDGCRLPGQGPGEVLLATWQGPRRRGGTSG
ncbi:hypothetical protein ABT288_32745 [Streptomyces sp. NPDC001093]|uniref:hypothetical protein n=1 Tax=Streptomyces sp. NPDC001093 TaxID=3154376 RepID=UPI00331CC4CA